MYCKIFPSQQVYDGMTETNIACDNVFVTDGWICLYKDEKFVASFDMMTINGWVLIDSTADTPQTEERPAGCSKDWSASCTSCERYFSCDYLSGRQTDCAWGEPITVGEDKKGENSR